MQIVKIKLIFDGISYFVRICNLSHLRFAPLLGLLTNFIKNEFYFQYRHKKGSIHQISLNFVNFKNLSRPPAPPPPRKAHLSFAPPTMKGWKWAQNVEFRQNWVPFSEYTTKIRSLHQISVDLVNLQNLGHFGTILALKANGSYFGVAIMWIRYKTISYNFWVNLSKKLCIFFKIWAKKWYLGLKNTIFCSN